MPLVTTRTTQGKMISLAGNLSALHRRIWVRLLSAQAHPRRVRRALPRIDPAAELVLFRRQLPAQFCNGSSTQAGISQERRRYRGHGRGANRREALP